MRLFNKLTMLKLSYYIFILLIVIIGISIIWKGINKLTTSTDKQINISKSKDTLAPVSTLPNNSSQPKLNTVKFARINNTPNKKIFVTPSLANDFLSDNLDLALAIEYLKTFNVNAEFYNFTNSEELIDYISKNHETIAIGLAEQSIKDESKLLISNSYNQILYILIAHKNSAIPSSVLPPTTSKAHQKTISKVHQQTPIIINNLTTYISNAELANFISDYPGFKIADSQLSIDELGDYVNKDLNQWAIIDRDILPVIQLLNPNIVPKLMSNTPIDIVWAISKKSKTISINQINSFFEDLRRTGRMLSLSETFLIDQNRFDSQDLEYFYKRIKHRLLPIIPEFKKAAQITNLPWTLLAALSYQESQWDNTAVSSTGARGLMMINEITAKQLDISQDDSAEQQILSGAKYLKLLRDDLKHVTEDDRTLIALSAYNIGPGATTGILRKIYGGKSNQQELKLEPAGKYIKNVLPKNIWQSVRWATVRSFIIEESKKGNYSSQPVILTERIRLFYILLNFKEKNGRFAKQQPTQVVN